jgi:hypothetical protein
MTFSPPVIKHGWKVHHFFHDFRPAMAPMAGPMKFMGLVHHEFGDFTSNRYNMKTDLLLVDFKVPIWAWIKIYFFPYLGF